MWQTLQTLGRFQRQGEMGVIGLYVLIGITGLAALLAGVVLAGLRYALVFPLHDETAGRPNADDGLAERLENHVRAIASVPHNVEHLAALDAAADTIETRLTEFGLAPTSQIYEVDGGIPVRNIEVVLEPRGDDGNGCTYVIGAHYDSPDDCPGANDNGTGVAALLEIARRLAGHRPEQQTVRLVFFVNEEAPYCKTPQMGSWQYARKLHQNGERVAGMMALETLGYFSDRPGSQQFPPPFNYIYRDRGDFVAFVGLPRARRFTHDATRAFRRSGRFPSIGGIAPGAIPGIDLSDHWSFNEFGFPALMVTDTAPFRNPYYHQPYDTPDTVDYDSLALITLGLVDVIRDLAP